MDELLDSISSAELTEWMALDKVRVWELQEAQRKAGR